MGRSASSWFLLNAAPYAMIRLVDDFSGTARWVNVGGAMAFVAIAAVRPRRLPDQRPSPSSSPRSSGSLPSAVRGDRVRPPGGSHAWHHPAADDGSGRGRGAVHRRHRAGPRAARWRRATGWRLDVLIQLAALVAVLSFFLGFAPPSWIRRAWREPDLRALPRALDPPHRAWPTIGRPSRSSSRPRRTRSAHPVPRSASPTPTGPSCATSTAGGSGWSTRTTRSSGGARSWHSAAWSRWMPIRADPENAAVYERAGASTVIAAPITADGRRMGVLTVYARAGTHLRRGRPVAARAARRPDRGAAGGAGARPRRRVSSGAGRRPPASRRSFSRRRRTTCARR